MDFFGITSAISAHVPSTLRASRWPFSAAQGELKMKTFVAIVALALLSAVSQAAAQPETRRVGSGCCIP